MNLRIAVNEIIECFETFTACQQCLASNCNYILLTKSQKNVEIFPYTFQLRLAES